MSAPSLFPHCSMVGKVHVFRDDVDGSPEAVVQVFENHQERKRER